MRNRILEKLTLTRKITIFYTVIFSITLFLLSMGVLYSVNVYQNMIAKKDIELIKKTIISEQFNEAEMMDIIEVSANQNISIMVKKNGTVVFRSEGFASRYKEADTYDEIWSFDDDRGNYMSEKTQFRVNSSNYELYIIKNLYSERRFLALLLLILIVMDMIGMIIAVVCGFLFARNMLKPIDVIANTAKSMNSDNLGARIPLPMSKDELYMLSKIFNDMADGLEVSFMKQAQFVADASHELKTPIAAIAGHVNLLNRWGKEDREVLDTSLESIQKETEYMSNLIKKLLFLAKLDNGRAVELEIFDLSALLTEIAEEMKVYQENYEIEAICEESVMIRSDQALVVQLIRILLDNAFKFTPEGGTVTVSCRRFEDQVLVQVKDTGIGMDEETKDQIFDRFYTENQSRNKELSGHGLGLSIAREIGKLLGIEIGVESQKEKGTTFYLTFH